jgi:hypothetical protein
VAAKAAAEDPRAVREAIRKALAVHGFVGYHGMRAYLARVHPVLDLISGLVRRQPAAALDAASYALRLGLSAYEKTDDPGGGFPEVLRQLADLHRQAARKSKPDAEKLARELFELQMKDQWDLLRFEDYAPALGKTGLTRYRKLAEAAWAERGHEAFKDELHIPLAEFLINGYHRAKRHDDAIALAWDQFTRWPSLSAYQRLKKSADRTQGWSAWRDKALAFVRSSLGGAPRTRDAWHWTAGGHSLLVDIFLWEGDSDAALAEARAGGCAEHLWFKLAQAREQDHPQDAIAIYRGLVDPIVERKHNQAYDEAAELIARIAALAERAGKRKEFAAWLEEVRANHKAKRNFMQRRERGCPDVGRVASFWKPPPPRWGERGIRGASLHARRAGRQCRPPVGRGAGLGRGWTVSRLAMPDGRQAQGAGEWQASGKPPLPSRERGGGEGGERPVFPGRSIGLRP